MSEIKRILICGHASYQNARLVHDHIRNLPFLQHEIHLAEQSDAILTTGKNILISELERGITLIDSIEPFSKIDMAKFDVPQIPVRPPLTRAEKRKMKPKKSKLW